jgi:hypothetical protein
MLLLICCYIQEKRIPAEAKTMKRPYSAPTLQSRQLELGVFGDYGQAGVPTPRRFDSFESPGE